MTRTLILARGLVSLLLATGLAQAQQAPVTGRMLGETAPATRQATTSTSAPQRHDLQQDETPRTASSPPRHAAPAPTPPLLPPVRPEPGDATRHLLRLQASGVQAGGDLPVLGDQAHASYIRYLKSFEHDIPEFFENTVGNSTPGGGN